MKKHRRYTKKTIGLAIEFHLHHCVSYSYIAKVIGCSKSTVERWVNEHYYGKNTKGLTVKQSKV